MVVPAPHETDTRSAVDRPLRARFAWIVLALYGLAILAIIHACN